MDTLKNFLLGLTVIILSMIIFVMVAFTWPFLIGISSIILSIIASILFVVLIFYIIVLIGYLVRQLIHFIIQK